MFNANEQKKYNTTSIIEYITILGLLKMLTVRNLMQSAQTITYGTTHESCKSNICWLIRHPIVKNITVSTNALILKNHIVS